jgi:hypothetical protein
MTNLSNILSTALTGESEITSRRSVEDWASLISGAWQSQIPSIIRVGVHLVDAQAALPRGEWKALVKSHLPFNRQTAFKLQKIGSDARLQGVSPGKHLPTHWTLLYELTKLTNVQLREGLRTGVINAKMRREDIKTLRGDRPPTPRPRRQNVREQLAEAEREIDRLRRSGGDLFGANDSPRDIATVLVNTINSPSKIKRIIKECNKLLRERARQEQAS